MHGSPHIVADVMTRAVITANRKDSFKDLVRIMQDHRVGALPVVDAVGRVMGVVSQADLLPKEEFRNSDPDRYTQLRRLSDLAKAGSVTAEELMTSPALTVRAGATLAQAARTMARSRVKRLPVVDAAGRLEGVVSRADLLKVFLRDDEAIAEEIRQEVVAYLLPAPASAVWVEVREGVVLLSGRVRDRALVPVAARLARAVEGVVDVRFDLAGDGSAAE
ncbi:CBS domain-containing protein [Streptomyces sp. NBC_00201]|uniref:CBS domain-containing protein n=1 Tax=unclassified Streptomyces TaxID=2593676 RepID=UPI00224F88F2|nr:MULTISPECIES: CBS domain-containing protein [unclassified Streptomyces]MCX5251377.1 CBS domain-containing protein [Streptomyces sp. NBC_00201]MCX5294699.1 CBS domain-containing protein [Streptomyces sp. NBC_00183]